MEVEFTINNSHWKIKELSQKEIKEEMEKHLDKPNELGKYYGLTYSDIQTIFNTYLNVIKAIRDYANNVDGQEKEHYQQIQEIAEGYYDLILNVDYNNIDYEKLKNKISKYVLYGTSGLKEYVDYVKEHKIQIEGKSSVMFPVIYYNGIEYVVRMKLEFEIKNTDTRNNLLYMDTINRTNKNIKYENDKYVIYIDAKMGNSISGSNALYNNNSMIYDLLLKDQKDIMVRE